MSVTVTQELTQQTVTVTGNPVENNVTVTVSNARGAAGPNTITTSTTAPSLTGYIFGNGTAIAGATAATNDATASTLVRRDASGGADFAGTVNMAQGVISDLRFEDYQAANAATFLYNGNSASDHRIALGAGTTGASLFSAASPAVANAILNIVKIATTDDSRTVMTYADDSELFVSLEVGSWLVDLRLLWGIASGANIAYRLQFTGVISTAVPIGHQLLRASIVQPVFASGYTETVNNSCHGALLLLNVTTAGTFKIDHRNNNATGTSIRRAGSAIIAKKIA